MGDNGPCEHTTKIFTLRHKNIKTNLVRGQSAFELGTSQIKVWDATLH